MERNVLKANEIIKIIEKAAQCGVTKIKVGEMEAEFNGFVKYTEKDYPDMVETIEDEDSVDPNFEVEAELERQQFETENLLINDPLAYEEMLASGEELEDSETMADTDV